MSKEFRIALVKALQDVVEKFEELKKAEKKKSKRRPKFCPDCGEKGETRGHYGCQFPQDTEEAGIEDPMEREK